MMLNDGTKVSEGTFSIAFDGDNVIEAGVLGTALSNIAYIIMILWYVCYTCILY